MTVILDKGVIYFKNLSILGPGEELLLLRPPYVSIVKSRILLHVINTGSTLKYVAVRFPMFTYVFEISTGELLLGNHKDKYEEDKECLVVQYNKLAEKDKD